jgi:hypothetical protein
LTKRTVLETSAAKLEKSNLSLVHREPEYEVLAIQRSRQDKTASLTGL